MTDDPRDILKAAGVECAEVGTYAVGWEFGYTPEDDPNARHMLEAADAAILALARLVAKYKWQRDECANDLGSELAKTYKYEATRPFAVSDVLVGLNRRWAKRNA